MSNILDALIKSSSEKVTEEVLWELPHLTKLKIIEIPDDVEFTIQENEFGQEWIAEKHRTWR